MEQFKGNPRAIGFGKSHASMGLFKALWKCLGLKIYVPVIKVILLCNCYNFFNIFTEQNLKRLRDINEEIQKLRMVNSQRGSREVPFLWCSGHFCMS